MGVEDREAAIKMAPLGAGGMPQLFQPDLGKLVPSPGAAAGERRPVARRGPTCCARVLTSPHEAPPSGPRRRVPLHPFPLRPHQAARASLRALLALPCPVCSAARTPGPARGRARRPARRLRAMRRVRCAARRGRRLCRAGGRADSPGCRAPLARRRALRRGRRRGPLCSNLGTPALPSMRVQFPRHRAAPTPHNRPPQPRRAPTRFRAASAPRATTPRPRAAPR